MKMIHLTFYVPDGLGFDKRYRFPLVTNPQNIIAVGDTYKNYSGPCFTEITMAEDFSKAFQHLMMDTREFYECGRKTQRKQVFAVLGTPKEIVEKWNECMGYETEEKKCP